jgi:cytochrome c oxidase cbb3-type subunit 3
MRATKILPLAIAALGFALAFASCQTQSRTPPAPQVSAERLATLQRGQEAFLTYCAMCHGDQGGGDGEVAATLRARSGIVVARLNDPETMRRLSEADIRRVITLGGGHTGRSNLMPAWGEKLGPRIIADLAAYVTTLADSAPAIPRSTLAHYLEAPPGVPAEGRALFVHNCAACHGPYGKGDGPFGDRLWELKHIRPRNLTDSTYLATRTDEQLFAVISLGGGHFRKAVYMPAWSPSLTPGQIKSIVAYVREISGTKSHP